MRLAGAARGAGRNGVRFHAARLTERSLIVDYDTLSAQDPPARDPVISSVSEGISLDARVVATGDGRQLRIDLRPSIALATAVVPFELHAQGVRVQTVGVVDFGLETQVLVNAGRVSLAGSARREEGGETEMLPLFVRAGVSEAK